MSQEKSTTENLPKTDADLKKIAVDLFEGKIYTDRHIPEGESLAMVFMPIALGAFQNTTEEEIKNIGLIYEYLDQAGPRSINGMPNFFSFKMLTRSETESVITHYDAYKKLKENFMN